MKIYTTEIFAKGLQKFGGAIEIWQVGKNRLDSKKTKEQGEDKKVKQKKSAYN